MYILQYKVANSKGTAGHHDFSLTSLVASNLPTEMKLQTNAVKAHAHGSSGVEALPCNIQLTFKFYIIRVISGDLLPIKRVWFISICEKELFHQKSLNLSFLDFPLFSSVVLITSDESPAHRNIGVLK